MAHCKGAALVPCALLLDDVGDVTRLIRLAVEAIARLSNLDRRGWRASAGGDTQGGGNAWDPRSHSFILPFKKTSDKREIL